ncbi:hypothetical protein NWO25_16255 [Enterococcus lactis]|nr:hypothetical protein [Enterococcus lactis]
MASIFVPSIKIVSSSIHFPQLIANEIERNTLNKGCTASSTGKRLMVDNLAGNLELTTSCEDHLEGVLNPAARKKPIACKHIELSLTSFGVIA